jgi:hypothetical protein
MTGDADSGPAAGAAAQSDAATTPLVKASAATR